MSNKKGFTLIELLAIIVILAIIAVITVPIILNIIENSKMGAASDSAYGYKDAVEKYFVSELYSNRDLKLVGEYNVVNGVMMGENFPDEGVLIPTDGVIPTDGYLEYSDNKLSSGCLVINDYAVSFSDGKVSGVIKGNCGSGYEPEVDISDVVNEIDGFLRDDGFNYFKNRIVVYYNPVTSKVCNRQSDDDKYVSSNSTAGFVSGCMKWYAYSADGKVTNMLLDHNINPSGTGVIWVSREDYDNSDELGPILGLSNMGTGSYGYRNANKGPLTALNYLKNRTASWSTIVRGGYQTYTYDSPTIQYSIDYTIDNNHDRKRDYKARLISAQEVLYIIRKTVKESEWQYNASVDDWLSDNWVTQTDGMAGYWTSSLSYKYYYDNVYCGAFIVGSTFGDTQVDNDFYGVRPVITVPSAQIFSN